MLGSHFDLKNEIARIAAKRAAELPPDPEGQADSQFDDKLRDFLRSLGGDTWSFDTADLRRSAPRQTDNAS